MGEAGAVGGHEVRGGGAGLEDFVVEEDAVVGCRARVCDVHARFGVAGGVHFFDFVHRGLAPEGRGCMWAGCLQGFPGPDWWSVQFTWQGRRGREQSYRSCSRCGVIGGAGDLFDEGCSLGSMSEYGGSCSVA